MRLLLACLIGCVALAAQAQSNGVYKWKDARGVTHYSDTPPPKGRYGSVAPAPAPRTAPTPAKVDPRCATARANIERLKGAATDIGLDADGDGKPDAPLAPGQRAEQLRLAQTAERSFCAPATP